MEIVMREYDLPQAVALLASMRANYEGKILIGVRKPSPKRPLAKPKARPVAAAAAAAAPVAVPEARLVRQPSAQELNLNVPARGRLVEAMDQTLPEIQQLLREGWCVFKGAASGHELQAAIHAVWDDSESLGTGILRSDPTTWKVDAWPTSAHGLCQHNGWGLMRGVCQARLLTEPTWRRIFKGNRAISSFDCMAIAPGPFQARKYPRAYDPVLQAEGHLVPNWMHLDQANRKTEVLRCVQGALALTRLGPAEQKTVLVVPKEGETIQSFRDRFLREYPTDPNEKKSLDAERGEWLKHTTDQRRWLAENGRVIAPELEPGDLLLWASGVSHASAPGPLAEGQTERGLRMTAFTSCVPLRLCSVAEIKKRQEILERGRTSGHRVLEPSLTITKDQATGDATYKESTTSFRQCVFDLKANVYGGASEDAPSFNNDRVLSGFGEAATDVAADDWVKRGTARFCGGYKLAVAE